MYTWSQNVFDKFVNVKIFTIGDKFEPFDESNVITVPTSTKPIKIHFESN